MKVMLGLLACAVCTAFADVAPDAWYAAAIYYDVKPG